MKTTDPLSSMAAAVYNPPKSATGFAESGISIKNGFVLFRESDEKIMLLLLLPLVDETK